MAKAKTKSKTSSSDGEQLPVPSMEDRAIKPLQDAAREYAEIRDQRIALNQQETALKKKILDIMHRHNRTSYNYDGVSITIEPPDGTEKVKVRIAKSTDEEGEEND